MAIKKNTVKKTAAAGQNRGHRVKFTYASEAGRQVFVAGSFNDWSPTARPLTDAKGNGEYSTCFLLKSGIYQYKFVVDGQWVMDPQNPRTVPNELGGDNNVLEVSID